MSINANLNFANRIGLDGVSSVVPEIKIRIKGGVLQYKIVNPNRELFDKYKSSIRVGLKWYRRGVRREGTDYERIGAYRMPDDGSGVFNVINIGGVIPANHKQIVFWSNPISSSFIIDPAAIYMWCDFPVSAEAIIKRRIYFVDENNRLSNIETALTKDIEAARKMMRIPGRSKKNGAIVLQGKDGLPYIKYTVKCEIFTFMNVQNIGTDGEVHLDRIECAAPCRVTTQVTTPDNEPKYNFLIDSGRLDKLFN